MPTGLFRVLLALMLTLAVGATSAMAQDAGPRELHEGWTVGPTVAQLGALATVSIPADYFFLNAAATRQFLIDNENIPDGDELGTILRYRSEQDNWFVVFSYADAGHIDDSDRNDLNADALLDSIRQASETANKERVKRGWGTMELVGWQQRPFYDGVTHNLTWAILGRSADGEETVNRSVRLLGRTGYMSAQLVVDPARADAAAGEFNDALRSFSYSLGSRYAEFRYRRQGRGVRLVRAGRGGSRGCCGQNRTVPEVLEADCSGGSRSNCWVEAPIRRWQEGASVTRRDT